MNTELKFTQIITYPAILTAAILMIPLIAMQFSEDVAWTLSDFVFAGILILGTGITYKLITAKSGNAAYKVAVGFALFTGFFLILSNLAVGIIGSENNDVNSLYFGVIFIGIIGAFIARFKPRGLSITLIAMAFTQAIISAFALFSGMADVPDSSVYEILTVNGFFITLFIVAAMLFRYAAQDQIEENA